MPKNKDLPLSEVLRESCRLVPSSSSSNIGDEDPQSPSWIHNADTPLEQAFAQSCHIVGDGSTKKNQKKPGRDMNVSLMEVLKESVRITPKEEEIFREPIERSAVLPPNVAIPLGPPRGEQPCIRYSREFSRTLMVGKDLLDETDICRSASEASQGLRRTLLNENIESLNSLQRCVFPHVVAGRDCVILGGTNAKKGKSLSYLAPLSHVCLGNQDYFKQSLNDNRTGPGVLILCSTWKSCHKVHDMLYKLIAGSHLSLVVVADHLHIDEQRKLEKHTDFVVTTPVAAVHMFNHDFKKFRFERLRYLVVDDMQDTFRYQLDTFTFLIEKIQNFRERMPDFQPLQTIFCGTEWTNVVASAMLNVCTNAVLILESSMASVQYGDILSQLYYFTEKSEKLDGVVGLCKGCDEGARIIIVCGGAATADEIHTRFTRESDLITVHILAEDAVTRDKIRQTKRSWDNAPLKQKTVLVVTDDNLKALEISNARCLIHYDLPLKRKEAFADRHMCLWNNYPCVSDFDERGEDALTSKVPLESHVYITTADREFEKIVLKLHDIGVSVPDFLLKLANEELRKSALKKELCESFKAFGKCSSTELCKSRHNFNAEEVANSPTVPRTGRVKLELIDMIHVTAYWARLVSSYDVVDGKSVGLINYSTEADELQARLNAFFPSAENLLRPREGSYCIVKDENANKIIRRGKVICALDELSDDVLYRIHCVDTAAKVVRRQKDIYTLPDDLSMDSVAPLCVTVYLSGMRPMANEPVYSPKAKKAAMDSSVKNHVFTGKIVLSIRNDVWVDALVEHEKVVNELIPIRNLRTEFTKVLFCAELHPEHMELLYRNCEEHADFKCDKYRALNIIGTDWDYSFFQKGERIEWAFLDTTITTYHTLPRTVAWCTYYNSLHEFFIQREDRMGLLNRLTEEMNTDIKLMISGKFGKAWSIFDDRYTVGFPVAAFDSVEKKWDRGIIVDKRIVDNESEFDIFFVDHGDMSVGMKMQELFPLKREFVTKLPFQAIRVGCSHILPLDDEFTEEFEDLARLLFIQDDIAQPLEVGVKTKERNHLVNGVELCKTYDCFILEPKSGNEVGELLEEQSLAKLDPSAIKMIEAWKAICLKHYVKAVDAATKWDEGDDSDGEDGDGPYGPDFGSDDDFDCFLGVNENSTAEEKMEAAANILKSFGILQPIEQATESKVPKRLAIETPASIPKNASFVEELETIKLETPNGPQLSKPSVEWKQTPEHIILWIHIPDLTIYTLKVVRDSPRGRDRIVFQCEEPSPYGFEIDLVGKILQDFVENLTGQHLCVKFKKQSQKILWPYLLHGDSHKKEKWLKRRLDDDTLDRDQEEGYSSEEEDTPATWLLGNNPPEEGFDRCVPAGYECDSDEAEQYSDDLVSDEDDEIGGGAD